MLISFRCISLGPTQLTFVPTRAMCMWSLGAQALMLILPLPSLHDGLVVLVHWRLVQVACLCRTLVGCDAVLSGNILLGLSGKY
jgi:hypothetical protein